MTSTLETCANTAARPASPEEGDTLFQIDTKQIIVWDEDSTAWRLYDSDGTAVNDTDITGIGDLHLWLDPAYADSFFTDSGKGTPVTADGKRVGCYADRAGENFDFVQATEAKKPTLCLDSGVGMPCLVYSTSDQLDLVGDSDSEIGSDQLTIFFVWRIAQENSHFFIRGSANGDNPRLRVNVTTVDAMAYQWAPFGSEQGDYNAGTDFSTSTLVGSQVASRHIYCLKTDLAGTDRTYTYLNGGADIAGSADAPETNGKFLEDTQTTSLFYGASNNSSPHWLFEFLVFKKTLTDGEVNTVNSYLGNKHGITVTDVS